MVMMITDGRNNDQTNDEPQSITETTESGMVRFVFGNSEEDPSGMTLVISSSSGEKVLFLRNNYNAVHVQGPWGNSCLGHEVWSSRLVGIRPLPSRLASVQPFFRLVKSFRLSCSSFIEPESAPLVSREGKKGKIRKTKIDMNEID